MASTADLSGFWRATVDGVTIAVKVHPKSRRAGLHGVAPSADGPRLRIHVTEAAEDGRANRAVCDAMAAVLAVPRSSVDVMAGASSREKLLRVAGDRDSLAARLAAL